MIYLVCTNLWSAHHQHSQLHSLLGSFLSVCFISMPALLTNTKSCALLAIIGLVLRFSIFITFARVFFPFFSIWHNYVLVINTCISQLSTALPEC